MLLMKKETNTGFLFLFCGYLYVGIEIFFWNSLYNSEIFPNFVS